METVEKTADTFKILSDPTRVKILSLLFGSDRDLCVNEIADSVGASHSATSHQLSKLEDKGLVECFRDGQMICYRVCDSMLSKQLRRMLEITK